ncbi:hypothetical protein [Leuconostoc lactis]|nr:hypothetical protein [Leuconostoc lactis]MDI6495466.1 hypothetical protein [Leuconostoc lactis]
MSENLTREQAEKKVNDCPDEYMAFMTPIDLQETETTVEAV